MTRGGKGVSEARVEITVEFDKTFCNDRLHTMIIPSAIVNGDRGIL